ncbi:MAG: type II toxin-antitoxin system RelE/ParE family toxin [Chthoniobacterales bacterium]|nr:type II toxin-antitoxin system RelE/ParE family toxin [Chthoniobacterales bacterium]
MRKRIILRQLAEQDLFEASSWYKTKEPTLGADFLATFERLLTRLEDHSKVSSRYYKNFRRVMLPRFPYKVFYRLEDHEIIIFRVLHAKRDHRRFLT